MTQPEMLQKQGWSPQGTPSFYVLRHYRLLFDVAGKSHFKADFYGDSRTKNLAFYSSNVVPSFG